MPDEADGSGQHEQAVQTTRLDQLIGLLTGEGIAGAQHVHKRSSDAAIDVQDQVGLSMGVIVVSSDELSVSYRNSRRI